MNDIAHNLLTDRTIAALCTPVGNGALALLRLSGPKTFDILQQCWRGKSLQEVPSHTVHLGRIVDENGDIIDEVVATTFRAPHSFTGDDTVEITCHGSQWIAAAILDRLVALGASPAAAGEFSQRAFINGRIDLAQAEGIADLIAADSRAAHRLAMTQARGQFSKSLEEMRDSLITLASLLELELDFSEEDVEFADRSNLLNLTDRILSEINRLKGSYRAGRAFKEGVPTVIAGVPNAGKSTLLNSLLREEKAIVSDIAGTTRDIIEDTAEIDGILLRFFDTAGLRQSDDTIERIGVERARRKISDAHILIAVIDVTQPLPSQLSELSEMLTAAPEAKPIILLNKTELITPASTDAGHSPCSQNTTPEIQSALEAVRSILKNTTNERDGEQTVVISGSARDEATIDHLRNALSAVASAGADPHHSLIVTNARHYEALLLTAEALSEARTAITTGLSSDLIAPWVRSAADSLGTISGTITTDTLLHTIFERFCIGK